MLLQMAYPHLTYNCKLLLTPIPSPILAADEENEADVEDDIGAKSVRGVDSFHLAISDQK
jgi:hypothetical protein